MKIAKVTELQKQMALVGISAMILVGLGVWCVIVPAVKKGAQLQIEIFQIAKKQELLKKIENSKERIKFLETDLLNNKERNMFLSHVTTLANHSGLEVDSVSPDGVKESTKGLYPAFGVRVKALGTFKDAISFIGELERKKPKLAITNIEFDRGGDSRNNRSSEGSIISVSIGAQTILLNSQETKASSRGV